MPGEPMLSRTKEKLSTGGTGERVKCFGYYFFSLQHFRGSMLSDYRTFVHC